MPLCVTVNFSSLPAQQEVQEYVPRINWSFSNYRKSSNFYNSVRQRINPELGLVCHHEVCRDTLHMTALDDAWSDFKNIILAEGKRTFGNKGHRRQVVPGWNDHVKDLYQRSRVAFLDWRFAGSPRSGAAAEHMHLCRAHFKLALRR